MSTEKNRITRKKSGVVLRKETIMVPNEKRIAFHVGDDQRSYSPSHWHEAVEIIYILEGTATVTVPDHSVTLESGQLILLNSGLVHSSRCPEYNRAILMQIPDDFLSAFLPDISKLWFVIDFNSTDPDIQENIRRIKALLLTMKDLQECALPGYLLAFHQYLFEFINLLYHNFRQEIPENYPNKNARSLSRLDAVITYTQQNYTEPISLQEAAQVAALQPEYFCRFFRQNMGMTYLQYLNDYRLSKVYHDLITTDLSIRELEEIHGFTNDKLFHRLFRERFQNTPLKIRQAVNR